jgi:AcrR family transcriptional regulator
MVTSPERPASDSDSLDVRDRIEASALKLFSEKGYAGTSLREIAEAARTTKPMIYYYFGSKEGLFASTLGSRLQEFGDAVDAATQADDDPCDKIRQFADSYLRYFQSQEPHIAFVLREVFGLGADIMAEFGRSLDQRIVARLKRVLSEGVAREVFRPCDVESCTVAIMGILNMFILRRVFNDVPIDREAAVDQVMSFYVEGLRIR